MSPEPEHRRTRRVPISYQVKLVSEDQLITYASAINLSLGGMLLDGDARLPLGSQCGVAILIADGGMGQRIVTRGTVVRDDAQGLAIAFSKALDPSSEDALRALLQSLDQPPGAEPSSGQPSTPNRSLPKDPKRLNRPLAAQEPWSGRCRTPKRR